MIAVSFGYIVALAERVARALESSPTREQVAHLTQCVISVQRTIDGIPTPAEISKQKDMPAGMYFPQSNEDQFSAYVPMSAVKAITK